MNIGIAGVGKMGAAIAARLMEAGNQATVWNRSLEKTKPLADAGAKIAATPADLAKAVDAVITILTDAAAINAVYGAPSGLLAAELKGKLFIDMSTVQPQTEIALAEKLRAKGAAFIECPIGGTTGAARQGPDRLSLSGFSRSCHRPSRGGPVRTPRPIAVRGSGILIRT